jgi:hypothetical protein
MQGVAKADPDLALREIIASKTQDPCFSDTLMDLLQREAEKGPAALASACKAVPWELDFCQSDDPFSRAFELSPDIDVAPWIESGAALALAVEGIQLGNLFSIWAGKDPGEAFEHWETWPDTQSNGGSFRVAEIFMAGMHSDDDRDRIAAAFERLPDVERHKVIQEIENLRRTQEHWAMQLEGRFPILLATEKKATK